MPIFFLQFYFIICGTFKKINFCHDLCYQFVITFRFQFFGIIFLFFISVADPDVDPQESAFFRRLQIPPSTRKYLDFFY